MTRSASSVLVVALPNPGPPYPTLAPLHATLLPLLLLDVVPGGAAEYNVVEGPVRGGVPAGIRRAQQPQVHGLREREEL